MEKIMNPSCTKQWILLVLPLFLGLGCHSMPTQPADEFPVAEVRQVHVTWSNQILVTTDYGTNQGAPLPGLVGHLSLMGRDLGHTVRSNGRVVVDLFDASGVDQNGNPKFLGRWQLSKENLARLGQKDILGLGYTLFLPWPDYKPECKKLQLQLTYLPDDGPTLISRREPLSLRKHDFKSAVTRVSPQPTPAPEAPRGSTVTDPGTEKAVSNNTVLVTTQEGQ
jgi:hypothetical protein